MHKTILFLFFVVSIVFASCDNEEEILDKQTGTVKDLSALVNCGYVIVLDNGKTIQPLYYPDSFQFTDGKRVFVEFVELSDIITTCNSGPGADIKYIEEISCTSIQGLTSDVNDTFVNDAVAVQEIKTSDKCITLKLSYSGGCRTHTVSLVCFKPVKNSSEVSVLEIRHNANNDLCEAWLTHSYSFDLKMIKSIGIKEVIIKARQGDGTYFRKNIVI